MKNHSLQKKKLISSATSATKRQNPLPIGLSSVADTDFICNHLQPSATICNKQTPINQILTTHVADVADKTEKKSILD
ncbi:MAG: hypothetical protein ACRCXN_08590 [Bacteroidales bacterium]